MTRLQRVLHHPRQLFAASLIVLFTLLMAALGHLATPVTAHMPTLASQPHTWTVFVGRESGNYAIQAMTYLPDSIVIDKGDTIVWKAMSHDIHTVTFLQPGQALPPFNPSDPHQLSPQGGHVYNGVAYYNSGLMSLAPGLPGGGSYSLTFGVTGTFRYFCLVHGKMMEGYVTVQPAGTTYPHSQNYYAQQIQTETQTILREGSKLANQAQASSSNLHVTLGIGGYGFVSVVRFFPSTITISAGQTVSYPNRDMMPHTVTFGPNPSNPLKPYGNPGHFDGKTAFNSGILLPGSTFTVTFEKKGTYHIFCALHDNLGMLQTVVVL